MPTTPGSSGITALDPKATLEKVTSLITELGDEPTETEAAAAPAEAAAAEPAPSETAAPPPSESEPAPDEQRFEVKVDGEPVLVDLDELKSSYTYKAHNTRTAQALAEERRAFDAESQAVQQDRTRYQQGLQQLTQALQQLQGEPDWDELHKELPADEFLRRKADWERSRAHLEKLQRHQQDEAQAAAEAQAAQYQKVLRAEQDKLKAAIPEWADATKAKAEQQSLVAGAKHYGFTEQEVLGVVDHRAILLLRDALKYRELHREPNAQAKAKVSGIKPAKPGTPERPRPNAEYLKKVERVQRTGRSRDAMDAIADLLPD